MVILGLGSSERGLSAHLLFKRRVSPSFLVQTLVNSSSPAHSSSGVGSIAFKAYRIRTILTYLWASENFLGFGYILEMCYPHLYHMRVWTGGDLTIGHIIKPV